MVRARALCREAQWGAGEVETSELFFVFISLSCPAVLLTLSRSHERAQCTDAGVGEAMSGGR